MSERKRNSLSHSVWMWPKTVVGAGTQVLSNIKHVNGLQSHPVQCH